MLQAVPNSALLTPGDGIIITPTAKGFRIASSGEEPPMYRTVILSTGETIGSTPTAITWSIAYNKLMSFVPPPSEANPVLLWVFPGSYAPITGDIPDGLRILGVERDACVIWGINVGIASRIQCENITIRASGRWAVYLNPGSYGRFVNCKISILSGATSGVVGAIRNGSELVCENCEIIASGTSRVSVNGVRYGRISPTDPVNTITRLKGCIIRVNTTTTTLDPEVNGDARGVTGESDTYPAPSGESATVVITDGEIYATLGPYGGGGISAWLDVTCRNLNINIQQLEGVQEGYRYGIFTRGTTRLYFCNTAIARHTPSNARFVGVGLPVSSVPGHIGESLHMAWCSVHLGMSSGGTDNCHCVRMSGMNYAYIDDSSLSMDINMITIGNAGTLRIDTNQSGPIPMCQVNRSNVWLNSILTLAFTGARVVDVLASAPRSASIYVFGAYLGGSANLPSYLMRNYGAVSTPSYIVSTIMDNKRNMRLDSISGLVNVYNSSCIVGADAFGTANAPYWHAVNSVGPYDPTAGWTAL